VIAIPGMDSFKEALVALSNDRWLSRGIAVLSIDGPGQYESPLLGVYVSMQNWIDAGPVLVDWLSGRPEIDAEKIGVVGSSFGSFFCNDTDGARTADHGDCSPCVVSGAGSPHNFRRGFANVQEALYVDVKLHR
jgi:hypothetical protein